MRYCCKGKHHYSSKIVHKSNDELTFPTWPIYSTLCLLDILLPPNPPIKKDEGYGFLPQCIPLGQIHPYNVYPMCELDGCLIKNAKSQREVTPWGCAVAPLIWIFTQQSLCDGGTRKLGVPGQWPTCAYRLSGQGIEWSRADVCKTKPHLLDLQIFYRGFKVEIYVNF